MPPAPRTAAAPRPAPSPAASAVSLLEELSLLPLLVSVVFAVACAPSAVGLPLEPVADAVLGLVVVTGASSVVLVPSVFRGCWVKASVVLV